MTIIPWSKIKVGDRVRLRSVCGTTTSEGVISEICRMGTDEAALQSEGRGSAVNAFRFLAQHPLRIFSNWNVVEVLA